MKKPKESISWKDMHRIPTGPIITEDLVLDLFKTSILGHYTILPEILIWNLDKFLTTHKGYNPVKPAHHLLTNNFNGEKPLLVMTNCGGLLDWHGIIIYGSYNDGKYLAHFGWEEYSQVIVSGNLLKIGYTLYLDSKVQLHKKKDGFWKMYNKDICIVDYLIGIDNFDRNGIDIIFPEYERY
ncbi:putative cysteine peptidase [[Mycoplasma] anseris]|uniref:Uncharacterized protein n=1 Tax=[Mycoplasma] anseris TaxID=92400 RepID=A0A2Z4NCS7_9BACT|nr:hypothetical protein [[Mycoplasma] anseris]AWX69359.1 hypothetical protein DP065_01135 [[Mycoplasma] anseris]